MHEWAYDLYKSDPDFKEYVDKYCATRHVGIFEALMHKMVLIVGEFYKARKEG